MECPYCREEIKDGARKCRICQEHIHSGNALYGATLRTVRNVLMGAVSIIVPVASLLFAFVEFQERVRAEEGERVAEEGKQIAEKDKDFTVRAWEDALGDIGQRLSRMDGSTSYNDLILTAAREGVAVAPGFKELPADAESRNVAQTIENLVAQGNQAFESGEQQEAERLFVEAANLERNSSQILQLQDPLVPKTLGNYFLNKDNPDLDRAVLEFNRAIQRDPEDLEARKGLVYAESLARAAQIGTTRLLPQPTAVVRPAPTPTPTATPAPTAAPRRMLAVPPTATPDPSWIIRTDRRRIQVHDASVSLSAGCSSDPGAGGSLLMLLAPPTPGSPLRLDGYADEYLQSYVVTARGSKSAPPDVDDASYVGDTAKTYFLARYRFPSCERSFTLQWPGSPPVTLGDLPEPGRDP